MQTILNSWTYNIYESNTNKSADFHLSNTQ